METLAQHQALEQELRWFTQGLCQLLHQHFEGNPGHSQGPWPAPPQHQESQSPYATLLHSLPLNVAERIALMLALAPHWQPEALDLFLVQNANTGRPFTEFGGVPNSQHRGFLPTGETLRFVLNKAGLAHPAQVAALLQHPAPLASQHLVQLGPVPNGEPRLSGALQLGTEAWGRLTHGQLSQPEEDLTFPATRLNTPLEWEDLVLPPQVREELEHIRMWIHKSAYLLEDLGLKKHLKPGYRSLFYGPPGTGKTLSACLLGKSTGRPVYRVDLSRVVSKYIGETEQNLRRVFDFAEHREWILFFDEADALFGKRTATKSSNDRHANQEVAYLLQRIEDFPGVVILASNLRGNLDGAFARRFQSMVYFPMPNASQRRQIWEGIFSSGMAPAQDLNLETLANDFTLAGGAAINVYRFAALCAAARDQTHINAEDMRAGIARELQKDGKTIPAPRPPT